MAKIVVRFVNVKCGMVLLIHVVPAHSMRLVYPREAVNELCMPTHVLAGVILQRSPWRFNWRTSVACINAKY